MLSTSEEKKLYGLSPVCVPINRREFLNIMGIVTINSREWFVSRVCSYK